MESKEAVDAEIRAKIKDCLNYLNRKYNIKLVDCSDIRTENCCEVIKTKCTTDKCTTDATKTIKTETDATKDVTKIEGPGVYIFVRDNSVFYVGETDNIARRVGNEHCNARIGASEGVVRFLMYLLDKVCEQADKWRELTVVDRENYIRENILMPMIECMEIIVITCPQLKDLAPRKKLEKCLIDCLNPLLQQKHRLRKHRFNKRYPCSLREEVHGQDK